MSRTQGFLDPADFPFVDVLERSGPIIREELDDLLARFPFQTYRHRPDGGAIVYEHGWEVFSFYQRGKKTWTYESVCPHTRELIELVPDVVTAGFSRLVAGGHIRPHAGKRELIRCHLGLIVPPACRFRVGNETRGWEVNKCLLFDNTFEHEAWNDSSEDRIIFVVDFVPHGGARDASRDLGTTK